MNFAVILKNSHLSLTRSRIRLMEILERSDVPISERDIEKEMAHECDRTTIYRNLSTLVVKGLAQRILSDSSVKYKLLSQPGPSGQMNHHVHFHCRICDRLICMEDLIVQDFVLPDGYSKIENQFLIVGICKDCNHVGQN